MEVDIQEALNACNKSAEKGHEIAKKAINELESTLLDAKIKINMTNAGFRTSKYKTDAISSSLTEQLKEIEQSFSDITDNINGEINENYKNLSKFTITVFGRTMAGKSTLMEILTNGNGDSIGKGSQRTTRDIRKYTWNQLSVYDVPGIGAYEGEEDEKIAYETVRQSDLVVFLLTDDGPQYNEAEWFSEVKKIGKPIICVINVKKSLPPNLVIAKKVLKNAMDFNRLNTIKNQFIEYGPQFGQDWTDMKFIYVHLLSAYQSQHMDDKELSKTYYNLSRIQEFKNILYRIVISNGQYYRIKNFTDLALNPMLNVSRTLIDQSKANSSQGRTIISKRSKIKKWQTQFNDRNLDKFDILINSIKKDLMDYVDEFVEENYNNPKSDINWSNIVNSIDIDKKLNSCLKEIEEENNEMLQEFVRQMSSEITINIRYTDDKKLKMKKIYNIKKVYNYAVGVVKCIAHLGAFVSSFFNEKIENAFRIGGRFVGYLPSGEKIFANQEEKIKKAKKTLRANLITNIEKTCLSIDKQIRNSYTKYIENKNDQLVKELDTITSLVFKLGDTQKELANSINDNVLKLNLDIVTEALQLLNSQEVCANIKLCGRVPGALTVIIFNDGYIPLKDTVKSLRTLLSERVYYTYYSSNKKIFLSRIIGKDIDRKSIIMDYKLNIATVPLENIPTYVYNHIIAAQQITGVIIN